MNHRVAGAVTPALVSPPRGAADPLLPQVELRSTTIGVPSTDVISAATSVLARAGLAIHPDRRAAAGRDGVGAHHRRPAVRQQVADLHARLGATRVLHQVESSCGSIVDPSASYHVAAGWPTAASRLAAEP